MLTKKAHNRGVSVVFMGKGCGYNMQYSSICPARASQRLTKFSIFSQLCLKEAELFARCWWFVIFLLVGH